MKIKFLILVTFLSPLMAFANNQVSEIRESLFMWQPIEISVNNGILSIISKERRVTDTIYNAMIRSGVCMGTIPFPNSLKGIKEIRVLNKFGRQGYVFEGGKSECGDLVKMSGSDTDIFILGRTHLHSN